MTTRIEPTERRAQILDEAVRQAARVGYSNIRREAIAEALGVSPALVNRYFATMPQLKRDVVRAAVATATGKDGSRNVPDALRVIAQGLAAGDRNAKKAPDTVRKAALDTVAA
jgi:AcrR family transcriptional regulator